MSPAVFMVLAVCLVTGACGVVLTPSPIRSALSLVATLFVMAVMFLLLDAQLVGVLQVVVYAGAIMVLFLFVIMLLNLQEDPRALIGFGGRAAATAVGALFVAGAAHFFVTGRVSTDGVGMGGAVPAGFGSTEQLAEALFTKYLLAFEITSVLLLVAIIGAVVLAKKTLA